MEMLFPANVLISTGNKNENQKQQPQNIYTQNLRQQKNQTTQIV